MIQLDESRRQSLRRQVDQRMRSWNYLRFNAYASGESLYMAGREGAAERFSRWLHDGDLAKAWQQLLDDRQYWYDLYNETAAEHLHLERTGRRGSKEYKVAEELMLKFQAAGVEAEHLLRLLGDPVEVARTPLPKLIARWTDRVTGLPVTSKF